MKIARPISIQPLPENAKKVFQGEFFSLYQYEVKGYDGAMRIFEKAKRRDTAMVVAITEDKKIILGLQEQPGKPFFTGLVGGQINEGEDALTAAKRELLEESGYEAKDWLLFDAVQPVSKVEWAIYTFIAKGCKKVAEQKLDGAEKIELKLVDFNEFIKIASASDFMDLELKIKVLEALAFPEKMAELKKIIMG